MWKEGELEEGCEEREREGLWKNVRGREEGGREERGGG